MLRAALKELLVGQHRQAGRAMSRVARGDPGGSKSSRSTPFARTGLLDLRDHRRLAGRDFGAYRTGEITHRRSLLGFGAQLRNGLAGFLRQPPPALLPRVSC